MVDVVASTKSLIGTVINTYQQFRFLRDECDAFRRSLRNVYNILDDIQREIHPHSHHHPCVAAAILSAHRPNLPALPNRPQDPPNAHRMLVEPMKLLAQATHEGGKVLERCTRVRILPVAAMSRHLVATLGRARDDLDDAMRILQVAGVGLQVATHREVNQVREEMAKLRIRIGGDNTDSTGLTTSTGPDFHAVADLIRDELRKNQGVIMQSLIQELVQRGVANDRDDCLDQLALLRMEAEDAKYAKALYDVELLEAVKLMSLESVSSRPRVEDSLEAKVTSLLMCPISLAPMKDPVLLHESGVTYDKEHLCQSLLLHPDLDPVTGQRFNRPLRYASNRSVKDIIVMIRGEASLNPYEDQDFRKRYRDIWAIRNRSPGSTSSSAVATEGTAAAVAVTVAAEAQVPLTFASHLDRRDEEIKDDDHRVASSPGDANMDGAANVAFDATCQILSVDPSLYHRPPPELEIPNVVAPYIGCGGVLDTGATATPWASPPPPSLVGVTTTPHVPFAVKVPVCLKTLPDGPGAGVRRITVWKCQEGLDAHSGGSDGGGRRRTWRAVTASLDGTVTVWDPMRYRSLVRSRAPPLSYTCCAVPFQRGTRILTTAPDRNVYRIVNLETGQTLQEYRLSLEDTDSDKRLAGSSMLCCTIFADESLVLGGFDNNIIAVWDLQTGHVRFTLGGHARGVKCCAILPCGRLALTGGGDGTIIVWDLSQRNGLCRLLGHQQAVTCLAAYGGGSKALSGSRCGAITVWDLILRRSKLTLRRHGSPVRCCTLYSNERRAVTGGDDATLTVWDLESGAALYRALRGHTGPVRCVAVHSNDERMLSGGDDDNLRVWQLPASDEVGQNELSV